MISGRRLCKPIVLALLATLIVLLSRGYWHDPHLARDSRMLAINAQAEQFSKGQVLLVGDSTAERFHLTEICGLEVLNAGVGRAKASEIEPLAKRLRTELEPSILIVSGGMNDEMPYAAALLLDTSLKPSFSVMPDYGDRPDGKHLSAASYRALKMQIVNELCP